MKLRSLEEIERDEKINGPYVPMDRKPQKPPGPLAIWATDMVWKLGRLLELVPRVLKFLFVEVIILAIIAGMVGLIVFGLSHLFM